MVAQPPPPEAAPSERLAVLPLHDEALFRAERAELRQVLALELARRAPAYAIVPLAEVDAKLRPVARSNGARCAFDGAPPARRAHGEGWLTTELVDVSSAEGASELWVRLFAADDSEVALFTAPWSEALEPAARYRAAFAALVPAEGASLLGGLMAEGDDTAALRDGPVTLCEEPSVEGCAAHSAAWKDRVAELRACFAGDDAGETTLLVEAGTAPRCESVDLDDPSGPGGAREACLCRALTTSAAFAATSRSHLRVAFEASDLAGKPRPELFVIDATTNLDSESAWHRRPGGPGGNEERAVHRLEVDALDALAAPLARCAPPPDGTLVAEIELRDDGSIATGRVLRGLADAGTASCAEKALARGRFSCTDDGKGARLRIAITWPPR